MSEDIHRLTIEKKSGGWLISGFQIKDLGDQVPWPYPFEEVTSSPERLLEIITIWAEIKVPS